MRRADAARLAGTVSSPMITTAGWCAARVPFALMTLKVLSARGGGGDERVASDVELLLVCGSASLRG